MEVTETNPCVSVIVWQWAQAGTQEVPPEYEEKLLSCEGARAVAQAAQGGVEVSFSGNILNPPGHSPVPPALGVPAQAGGLDEMISRGPFQPLPSCASMNIAGTCWHCKNLEG